MTALPLGPVIVGVEGLALTSADRARLAHPSIGGVILFARNYASPEELTALTASIKALRDPPLLVCVDHEGGRVQRFRDGFSAIPPMRTLGEAWDRDIASATEGARRIGATIASELHARGVDFTFAPVLDLDHGASGVIGDRAFHRNPNAAAHLAAAFVDGLHGEGMSAVGKHFPGHGHVAADSHDALPRDERSLAAITAEDLVPFAALIKRGLDGVMPAHVVYPDVDELPAGYSPRWLQDILRGRLGFDGTILSDDLEMVGAQGAGDVIARADAALVAGCDVVLVCNDMAGADSLLSGWIPGPAPHRARRLARMRGSRR